MKQLLTYKVESYMGVIFVLIFAIAVLLVGWRILTNVSSDIDLINIDLGTQKIRR